MHKIIQYEDFSQQKNLLGESFWREQNKKNLIMLYIFLPISIMLMVLNVLNINICYKAVVVIGVSLLMIFVTCMRIYYNLKVNKQLTKRYIDYKPKFNWKIEWEHFVLFEAWQKEAYKKIIKDKFSKKDVQKSLDYYKFVQPKATSFYSIQIFIALVTFLLVAITLIVNLIKNLNENQILFILSLNGLVLLANIILITVKQNREDANNRYKKMQILCEFLLGKIAK